MELAVRRRPDPGGRGDRRPPRAWTRPRRGRRTGRASGASWRSTGALLRRPGDPLGGHPHRRGPADARWPAPSARGRGSRELPVPVAVAGRSRRSAVPVWLHLRAKTGVAVPFTAAAVPGGPASPAPRRRAAAGHPCCSWPARGAAAGGGRASPGPTARDWRAAVTESRVHVLDNTLSQQADGGFTRDRDRSARRSARRGPTCSRRSWSCPRAGPRAWWRSATTAQRPTGKLAGLEPSFQRGSYLEAFRLAHSVLSRGLGDPQERSWSTATTRQNQWAENGSRARRSWRALRWTCARGSPRSLERANVAVGEPAVRRFFLGERTFVDFQVALSHGRLDGPGTVTWSWRQRPHRGRRSAWPCARSPRASRCAAQWPSDPSHVAAGEAAPGGAPGRAAGRRPQRLLPAAGPGGPGGAPRPLALPARGPRSGDRPRALGRHAPGSRGRPGRRGRRRTCATSWSWTATTPSRSRCATWR